MLEKLEEIKKFFDNSEVNYDREPNAYQTLRKNFDALYTKFSAESTSFANTMSRDEIEQINTNFGKISLIFYSKKDKNFAIKQIKSLIQDSIKKEKQRCSRKLFEDSLEKISDDEISEIVEDYQEFIKKINSLDEKQPEKREILKKLSESFMSEISLSDRADKSLKIFDEQLSKIIIDNVKKEDDVLLKDLISFFEKKKLSEITINSFSNFFRDYTDKSFICRDILLMLDSFKLPISKRALFSGIQENNSSEETKKRKNSESENTHNFSFCEKPKSPKLR